MESAILDFEKDVVRGDHVLINYTIFCDSELPTTKEAVRQLPPVIERLLILDNKG